MLDTSIDGNMFNVIVNMYSDIKSRILDCWEHSDCSTYNTGDRQGENLFPVLFSLFHPNCASKPWLWDRVAWCQTLLFNNNFLLMYDITTCDKSVFSYINNIVCRKKKAWLVCLILNMELKHALPSVSTHGIVITDGTKISLTYAY